MVGVKLSTLLQVWQRLMLDETLLGQVETDIYVSLLTWTRSFDVLSIFFAGKYLYLFAEVFLNSFIDILMGLVAALHKGAPGQLPW